MKTKRWMAAALTASLQPLPALPWARLAVTEAKPASPAATEPLGTAC